MSVFDDQTLPLKCPECGHEMPIEVRRLKDDPVIPCGGCGKPIQVEAKELRDGLRSAEDAIRKFGERFGGFK